jgi:mRNA (guanine-N7-)-methyltransferase
VVISLHETAADPPQQSILELPKKLLEPTFDNVSMQFCIHYAFEKVQNVRQMLENVAMYLREGGIYFGTTVSKDKIV